MSPSSSTGGWSENGIFPLGMNVGEGSCATTATLANAKRARRWSETARLQGNQLWEGGQGFD